MEDLKTLLIATTFLAIGGLGLYMFKSDELDFDIDDNISDIDSDTSSHTSEASSLFEEDIDDWNWEKGGTAKFLDWLQTRFKSIPQHSGSDTTGIERAISYFERLNVEISRAMKKDYKREIDAAKAEEARAEIMKGLERLLDRLEKLNPPSELLILIVK
jgi:hypothetical protein